MKLVSACLLGIKCRYDGKSKPNEKVLELSKKETLIPFCPEQAGGLPTPRVAQEIQGCSGEVVLDGKCKVMNKEGRDVTEEFIRGAIMKQRSPSCGCGLTFDGTFSKNFIKGDGVAAALLKRNGIKVMTEEDL